MKWFVTMHTGYCGEDGHDVMDLPSDMSGDEVQKEAYFLALDNASMYGRYPPDCDEDGEDTEEDSVSDDIDGYAVPYDPKLHDMYKVGGGSFLD